MLLVLETSHTEERLISNPNPSARNGATRRPGLVPVDNEACRNDFCSNMDEPKDVNAGSTESYCKARAFHDGAVRRPAGGADVVEALEPITGIDDTQVGVVYNLRSTKQVNLFFSSFRLGKFIPHLLNPDCQDYLVR